MKSRILNHLVPAMLSILSFGCAEKPVFLGIGNIKPIGIVDSTFQISMDLIMYNPNSFGSKLVQSDMALYYGEEWMGTGVLSHQVDLKAKDTVHLQVVSHINLDKLARFYPELIDSDSTEFTIQGVNRMTFMLKSFKVRLQDKIQVNTRQVIASEMNRYLSDTKEIGIKSLSFDKMPGVGKTAFKAVINYGNNIPFDYTLQDLKVAIYVNNSSSPVANWMLDRPIHQKANSTSEIPLEIDIDNLSLMGAMNLNMLFSQKVELRLVGSALIEIQGHEFDVPVETDTSIPIKDLANIMI